MTTPGATTPPTASPTRPRHLRRTIAALHSAAPSDERENTAKEAMLERLGLEIELYDAHITTSRVSVVGGQAQEIRAIFDLMPTEGEQAWRNITASAAHGRDTPAAGAADPGRRGPRRATSAPSGRSGPRSSKRALAEDRAATEAPLEIRLHGQPFVITMRTPGADRDLAAGFLLSEQVVHRHAAEIAGMTQADDESAIDVTLQGEALAGSMRGSPRAAR